jgi:transcriptional regulator with XRE-family HTH domain
LTGISFPEFITSRRRELDLTLGDVASRLGVSPITVSNWSNGDSRPKPDKLAALADLLDVPAGELAAMAGINLATPDVGVNLMPTADKAPAPAEPSNDEVAIDKPVEAVSARKPTPAIGDPTGDEPTAEEPTPGAATKDEAATATPTTDEKGADEPTTDSPASIAGASRLPDDPAVGAPEPKVDEVPIPTMGDDAIPVTAASVDESPVPPPVMEEPDSVPAFVAAPEGEPKARPLRRPSLRRPIRPATADDSPVAVLPLTYIEDPRQLMRYRIRWALTVVVLVIMFFILLWASRELLSALSEVKQAVTPGGIGGG